MRVETQEKNPDIIEQIKNDSKNSLLILGQKLYDEWNTSIFPFKENMELKNLVENEENNKKIINKLLKILPVENLA